MRPTSRSSARVSGLLFLLAPLLVLANLAPPPARAQTACDYPPVVDVKHNPVSAAVGVTVHVLVTAHDPNGESIAALTADTSGLPAGNDATFTPDGTNTGGELTWTPQPGQTGAFTVTFTASNALSGSATATIDVTDTGGAPFVQAPSFVDTRSLEPTTFDVYAGDPDGDAILSLDTSGLPSGATFTKNASNTMGTFSWTPGFADDGSYAVTFIASNALADSATTFVNVLQVDRPPLVTVPASATGTEGSLLTICALATDPDGDAIATFTVSPLPSGASVTVDPGNEALTFQWTPAAGQAGSYDLFFTASNALSASVDVAVTILPGSGDRPPVVTAPASVAARTGDPVTVGVTASDPDGDTILSLDAAPLPPGATFSTNMANTAGTFFWTPGAGQQGSYSVVFTAANALSASATTVIDVTEGFQVLLFTTGGNKTIRLRSGRPHWCVDVEPVGGSFDLTNIDPASIVLQSAGTGSVSEIAATAGKTMVIGDQNHDDIPDLEVCFAKEDLRALFDGLSGKTTVTVSLEADLLTGGRIHGDLSVDVAAQGGALAASLSPNPPSGMATLSFVTTDSGWARVRLYDVHGRLVRTVLDERGAAAGLHRVSLDGRGADGGRLPSGVYFFRIDAAEGSETGRFALVY
ncbi:MAG: Ig-like domain-containing protein [Hyphomicrobiales bacterium]